MAWTDPITWTADQLVKAEDLNKQIRDNMLVLKTPIADDGRILEISSTTFASLDGTALTGLAKLASANVFTAKSDFSAARVIVPVGADKWAT